MTQPVELISDRIRAQAEALAKFVTSVSDAGLKAEAEQMLTVIGALSDLADYSQGKVVTLPHHVEHRGVHQSMLPGDPWGVGNDEQEALVNLQASIEEWAAQGPLVQPS